jgi:hypothetical protein
MFRFRLLILKEHLHYSVINKSQNSRNQGFSDCFCLTIEGSGSESVPVPLTTGGPKTTDPEHYQNISWILIDPQHWIKLPVSRCKRRDEGASVQPPPSRRSTHTGGSSDLAQQ